MRSLCANAPSEVENKSDSQANRLRTNATRLLAMGGSFSLRARLRRILFALTVAVRSEPRASAATS